MDVEGMTRENVASHLQKYRLYLKKIAGYQDKERINPDVLQRIHECNVQHMALQQSLHYPGSVAGMCDQSVSYESVQNDPLNNDNAFASFGAFPATFASAKTAIEQYEQQSPSAGLEINSVSLEPTNKKERESEAEQGRSADEFGPEDVVDGIPLNAGNPPQGGFTMKPNLQIHTGSARQESVSLAPTIAAGQPVSPTVTKAVNNGGHFDPEQGWQYPPLPAHKPNICEIRGEEAVKQEDKHDIRTSSADILTQDDRGPCSNSHQPPGNRALEIGASGMDMIESGLGSKGIFQGNHTSDEWHNIEDQGYYYSPNGFDIPCQADRKNSNELHEEIK